MALVGEIIMGAREIFTDLPQGKLTPPSTELTVSVVSVPGSTLPAGTYLINTTYRNQFGETTVGTIFTGQVIGANQGLRISGTLPPGVTAIRAYFGIGSATQLIEGTSLPLTISTPGTASSAPTRNTAYLPDTDGQALGAAAIYRWLNEGLHQAATICDGLPDFTAVGTIVGVGMFVFPGNWRKIGMAWYDGYPIMLGSKNDVFRKNAVTGIVGTVNLFQNTDRLVLEIWPQAARTSGQTTLSSQLALGATTASLATSNFQLSFGLALIGSEVVYYATNSGGQLNNLIRGMAGTLPQVWPIGTAVTELNLMLTGNRVPTGYSLGSSTSTFYLPPGWEDAIETYLISRYRKAEQETKEASALLQEFTAKVQKLSANKIIAGPRQIQAYAGQGTQTYPGLGSPFGGVIVP